MSYVGGDPDNHERLNEAECQFTMPPIPAGKAKRSQMNSDQPDQKTVPAEPTGDERLDSWKEIASYLKREVRTLHRWEAHEGLPIHRHLHKQRGSVYAYKSELDAWWDSRRTKLERPAAAIDALERPGRLRLVSMLFVAAILLAATSYLARNRIWPRREPGRRVTLAVLPFENLSGRAEEDYFSDGLTDELITQLGALEPARLGVTARTSAMQYKRAGKSATQVGHELGVGYILEGTVRREDNRVRVAVKLVQVSDQTLLWTEIYEQSLGHIMAFHGQVARDVARRIQIQLTPQEQATLSAARPVDPEAYEAYLKGLYFWNKFTNPNFHKSIEYFKLCSGVCWSGNFVPESRGVW